MAGSTAVGLLSSSLRPATLLVLFSAVSFAAVGGTWLLFFTAATKSPAVSHASAGSLPSARPPQVVCARPARIEAWPTLIWQGVFGVFLLLTTFEFGLGGYMAAIATLKVTAV